MSKDGPPIIAFKDVLINLNDEAGRDWYSVEYADDIGNWLDSFDTLDEAHVFVSANKLGYVGFRDTRGGK
jgi:hypothetical protein